MLKTNYDEFLEFLFKIGTEPKKTPAWSIRAEIGEVTEEKVGSFGFTVYSVEVTHTGFTSGWLAKSQLGSSVGEQFALSNAKERAALIDRRWSLSLELLEKNELNALLERYANAIINLSVIEAIRDLAKDEFRDAIHLDLPEPPLPPALNTTPTPPILKAPVPPKPVEEPQPPILLDELGESKPEISDAKYAVEIGFMEKLFQPNAVERKIQQQKNIFKADYDRWCSKLEEIRTINLKAMEAHSDALNRENERYRAEWAQFEAESKKYQASLADYKESLAEYEATQNKYQADVAEHKRNLEMEVSRQHQKLNIKEEEISKKYFEEKDFAVSIKLIAKLFSKATDKVFCFINESDKVLLFFAHEAYLSASQSTRTLVVNYKLPLLNDIPSVIEIKEMKTSDDVREKRMSKAALERFYDEVLYKICLGSISVLFAADEYNLFDAVVFNGYVDFVDGATGKDASAFIMSLQTTKQEFANINLLQVDPKLCFNSLKGVGSSKLHAITPIRPILNISKDDPRFVDAVDVAGSLDASTNLASIDWQEFEHLIRQIFDKEFSQNGGEVKITQASRDGGVDAVAFDNDPIRGGKIVIQAKRYTNTVGVSAVRDLYGTVMNEGAMKGILVTTSDFGPDAHSFAKGKPLTLISGAELLYLFQKHGYEAKIDIRAAKELAAKNNRYN